MQVRVHAIGGATLPPEVVGALAMGGPAPPGLTERERQTFDASLAYAKKGSASYFTMLSTRSQTVGYGATDSPAGLAYRPPESWGRRVYPTLFYFHEVARGVHFAAWEQPELFASELRAAFKTIRGPQ